MVKHAAEKAQGLILAMLLGISVGCASFMLAPAAQAAPGTPSQPVITDTRIKTLVYNENEVYRIVAHYGFQSNIEFGPKEEIDTISVGDQVAWQIIPSNRHLFIRAMAFNTRTNMTVITNKRIYQFDLVSPAQNQMQRELSYVVRFYYPDEHWDNVQPANTQPAQMPSIPATQRQSYNQNYTLSGPETMAPVKIYDDNQQTYFQFREGMPLPQIYRVTMMGQEEPLPQSAQGSLIMVPGVHSRFSLRTPTDVVCVFNESM